MVISPKCPIRQKSESDYRNGRTEQIELVYRGRPTKGPDLFSMEANGLVRAFRCRWTGTHRWVNPSPGYVERSGGTLIDPLPPVLECHATLFQPMGVPSPFRGITTTETNIVPWYFL